MASNLPRRYGPIRCPTVLLNGQLATFGVSATARYVRALVRSLVEDSQIDLTLFEYCWRKRPYSDVIGIKSRRILWPMPPRIGEFIFEKLSWLQVKPFGQEFDILHLPDYTLINARARRVVATLHTAGPLERPELFGKAEHQFASRWLERTRRRCDLLISVSEHLRQTVIHQYGYPADRVVAIPLGIEPMFRPATEKREARQTLLYVGRVRVAKNVQAVCQAFLRLHCDFPDLELKLVGPLDVPLTEIEKWLGSSRDALSRTGLIDSVGPNSRELLEAYQNASVFVFPSYAEGWTSPPLEAMACGIPVVASTASSLPETVGDAALTVDPDDHDALAESIRNLLEDDKLRIEQVRKGLLRAAEFTWEAMVRRTIDAYSSIL